MDDWRPDVNVHHNYPPSADLSGTPRPPPDPPREPPPAHIEEEPPLVPPDWDDDPDEDQGDYPPAERAAR